MSNLKLWDSVEKTDPAHTKPFNNGGHSGTSIVPQYLFKKATEAFGVVGDGWGYEIVKNEIIEGADMIVNSNDVATNYGPSKVNTVQVRFWYMHDGKRCEVDGIGHTPFVYLTKRGPITDFEYQKKSVTDALTKAMSLVGFGADIRMGMYEQPNYVNEIKDELELEQATDKSVARFEQRSEFVKSLKSAVELMETSKSLHEIAAIYTRKLPEVERKGNESELVKFKTIYSERVKALKAVQQEASND